MRNLLASTNRSSCDEVEGPMRVEYMHSIWIAGMIYQASGALQDYVYPMDGKGVFSAALDYLVDNARHDHIAFFEVAEGKNASSQFAAGSHFDAVETHLHLS